ncbi:hypothetical protein BST61_g7356 [Cercospora zeina]
MAEDSFARADIKAEGNSRMTLELREHSAISRLSTDRKEMVLLHASVRSRRRRPSQCNCRVWHKRSIPPRHVESDGDDETVRLSPFHSLSMRGSSTLIRIFYAPRKKLLASSK